MEIALISVVTVGVCLLFFRWLASGTSGAPTGKIGAQDASGRTELTDDMREIGNATGMLGGGIADGFIAQFAIRRAKLAARERVEAARANGETPGPG